MKYDKSKRPAKAGNKINGKSRSFSKPLRDSGALNLQNKRENTQKIDIFF